MSFALLAMADITEVPVNWTIMKNSRACKLSGKGYVVKNASGVPQLHLSIPEELRRSGFRIVTGKPEENITCLRVDKRTNQASKVKMVALPDDTGSA